MKASLIETRHSEQALLLPVLYYGVPVVRFYGIQQTVMFAFFNLGPVEGFWFVPLPAKSLFNVHGFANMVFDKMKGQM